MMIIYYFARLSLARIAQHVTVGFRHDTPDGITHVFL